MKTIEQIASDVREVCEEYFHSPRAQRAHAKGDFYDNLGGMCAIASFVLVKALELNGYLWPVAKAGFFKKYGTHCWVEVGDKVVDITATQYDDPNGGTECYPLVYITNYNDKKYRFGKEVYKSEDFNWVRGNRQLPRKMLVNKLFKDYCSYTGQNPCRW
jgi:hypothetical protein